MRYVVMIASYKRPQCKTIHTLQRCGYDGEWYIVADDGDPTEYEDLYPGHVLRFSKAEWYEKVDTMDNFEVMVSAIYAYNFSWEWAKEHGYDSLVLCDDDLHGLSYRCVDETGRLPSKKVHRIGEIIDCYCRYIHNAGIWCTSFINGRNVIGGAQNPIVKKGYYVMPMNIFIMDLKKDIPREYPFVGTLFLDGIYAIENNMTGRVSMAFMPIFMNVEKPETCKSGGYSEIYEKQPRYIAESYGNMALPSLFKWENAFGRFKKDCPLILNEKWRKERA